MSSVSHDTCAYKLKSALYEVLVSYAYIFYGIFFSFNKLKKQGDLLLCVVCIFYS